MYGALYWIPLVYDALYCETQYTYYGYAYFPFARVFAGRAIHPVKAHPGPHADAWDCRWG